LTNPELGESSSFLLLFLRSIRKPFAASTGLATGFLFEVVLHNCPFFGVHSSVQQEYSFLISWNEFCYSFHVPFPSRPVQCVEDKMEGGNTLLNSKPMRGFKHVVSIQIPFFNGSDT
jgi:hypothetical protein